MNLDLSTLAAFIIITTTHFEDIPEDFNPAPYSLQINLFSIEMEICSKKEVEEFVNRQVFVYKGRNDILWINTIYHELKNTPSISDGDFIIQFGQVKAEFLRDAYAKRIDLLREIMNVGGGFYQSKYREELNYCERIYELYRSIYQFHIWRDLRFQRQELDYIRSLIGPRNFYGKVNLEIY